MSEKPPIDGSGTNPYPPPPPGWEPQQLTQDLHVAIERAVYERLEKIAQARNITVRKAVPFLLEELRALK